MDALRRLSERWRAGIRLLHASAGVSDEAEATPYIIREKAWSKEALEDAAPWPALRLEPLGDLKPEEQRILSGMTALGKDHEMSLVCLAVRLSRIADLLDRMVTKPAKRSTGGRHKGDGEIDDGEALTAMAAVSSESFGARATTIVDVPGYVIRGISRDADITRLRRKFGKLVSNPI